MSLDVTLTKPMPTEVFGANITHNLTRMALHCELGFSLTLYEVLWRPDEHGLTHAKHLTEHLTLGLQKLRDDPLKYKAFDPENGWGNYEGLVDFVKAYRDACESHPDAEVGACR